MATTYTGNLIEDKRGNIKLRGTISGLTTPKKGFGYSEVAAKGDKHAYRSIKFFVATNSDNKPTAELIGSPKEFAYGYSKKEKKSMKIEWAKRNNKLPGDYELIVPEYDLIKKLSEELKDGDNVVVIGEPKFSVYDNPKSGVLEEQTNLNIKFVFPCTDVIDFNAEDFVEEATFSQAITVRDFSEDTKAGKAFLFAYVVLYGGKFVTTTFNINLKTIDQSFYRNLKSLKFGDSIRVNGLVQNRVLKETVEVNDGWGTNERVNSSFYKALEITGADGSSLIKKRYKEIDFVESQVDATFSGKINVPADKPEDKVEEEVLPFQL
jgi:hypothetical protein